ncbi:MAG: cytochrome P450 [Cytophagales bacterium]|nr:cytochrome P450 [Cytophagales bacterium]
MTSKPSLKTIPQLPPKPIVGNMLSIDTQAPIQNLNQLAQQLGPIYRLDMMGSPIVFVSGHQLVDELSDDKRFDKTVRGTLRRVRAIAGDGLFTADTTEPNWGRAHNILLQPFGNRAMQSYHPMMVDIADQLIKKWERLNTNDEIDVVHDMTALTLDTIGLCGFDYRFNSFYRRDYHPFVESLVRSLETVMMIRGIPLEGMWMKKRQKDMAADIAFMNQMVDQIVVERRKNEEAIASKKDMLGAMMTGVDKTSGEKLDDLNIRYQINTFLIAGHETTSGLLSYAIYALLKHPEILNKAYAEVDQVLGADHHAKPTYQQVTQLTYIEQILKETLRLWPPAPAYSITPLQDETLGGQYQLKKGTFVTVLVGALHRDKSVWGATPDVFNPEHFSKEAEAARPINAWKPFGNGQRACIGRGFAMHEAILALGMILQRFRLIDHNNYQLQLKEALTIKPEGFKIKVSPRADSERGQVRGAVSSAAAVGVSAPVRARPGHNTPLLVLYGSNLGTAEELAARVADLAEVNGFVTKLAPLDDYVGQLPADGAVVIFCSSYNGAPPDNASKFMSWLEGDLPTDALAQVRYAVFGCGNTDWPATYQHVPRTIDQRMKAHGATNVYVLGEGNARGDLDGEFETWFAQLRTLAVKQFNLDTDFGLDGVDAPLYQIEPVAPSATVALLGTGDAVAMKITANHELQNKTGDHASDRSTRHIELELPSQLTYRAGDHLSVMPRNDPALVDAVARRFGFLATDQIRLHGAQGRRTQLPVGESISVGRLLTEYIELQLVATRKQIQTMAEHTRCPMTKPKLLALSGDDTDAQMRYRTEVMGRRKSVVDLMLEFPACELPFHVFLEKMSLLTPRYYSISSSPLLGQAKCSVTVAVVEAPAASGRGVFKGVCSNYLATRQVGDTIFASIRDTKDGFRLPADTTKPIIMVGPGTGLAPFRGFLQERRAQQSAGKTLGAAMLFFGCRHPEQDFLYADELKDFAAVNVVDVHVAFSRLGENKTYVQQLLLQEKERVWQLIEQGAVIYVCGDGSKMEPDVKAALTHIYSQQANANQEMAQQWMEAMSASNRYVLDVWAGN